MHIIIIGSGLSGYQVLQHLRTEGFAGSITMISEHDGSFYSKPSLSNAVTQNKEPDNLIMLTRTQAEEKFKCKIMPKSSVLSIDRVGKSIKLEKATLQYDKLVLAVGAKPVDLSWLPVSDNIHRVNHLSEYEVFRQKLDANNRLMIIGGGLIGVEFSHDLSSLGSISLIEAAPSLMASFLPEQMGKKLESALVARGVDVELGAKITSVEASDVVSTKLSSGRMVEADMALIAVGLVSNTSLAREAGIATAKGILVNHFGLTSDPDIYAVGDCAEVCGLVRHYVAPLRICAAVIAEHIVGKDSKIVYPPLPVMLKFPSYPVCFCFKTPPQDWEVKEDQDGIKALAFDQKELVGFAVSGSYLPERNALKKRLVNWI